MDQKKIGSFLKELRKETGLTQEQQAEHLNLSRRTISRWETGSNMPDLDVLIELADFYGVDLRELLDGERKSEKMNKELEDTVLKVADYSNEEKQKLTKRMHLLFIVGLITFVIYLVMEMAGIADKSSELEGITSMSLGISFGMMVVGVIMTGRHASKVRAFKMRLVQRKKAA